MGVHGLWKLIEPSGQMVPLESLAGKVLAVDVSIWLHQAVKGVHDAHGAPIAVAHLLVLFHRVCKLLFYKIKPVFVFDGGVPLLKRQTMAARRQRSNVAKNEAMKVREKLIKNLLKHEAVRHMLSDETASAALGLNSFTLPGPSAEEDLYKLPPIAVDCHDSECSEELSSSEDESEKHIEDIHSIDVTSQEFLSLPAEVRHDILTELIETRKQSSWKYLDSMPKKSDSFSDFQMSRLLKRHAVQTSLEKAGKEMGGRALSLKELESLLGDQGILDPRVEIPSKRIAQDNVTRYMLVQKTSEEAESEGQSFDIMNHLEDVEWSSESDTDVICQKSQTRRKGNLVTVDKTSGSEEKMVETSISNRPKMKMTQEVVDILSILEDKHAETNVKERVENLQTKIDLKENFPSLKPNQSETAKPKNDVENQTEVSFVETSTSVSELEKQSDEKVKELTVVKIEKNNEKLETVPKSPTGEEITPKAATNEGTVWKGPASEETAPKTSTDVETVSKASTNEGTASTGEETAQKAPINEVTAWKAPAGDKTEPTTSTCEQTAESSSDSESDFITITTEKAESAMEISKEKNGSPIEVPEGLTVVINPLESHQKDDLFADIFEPHGEKPKETGEEKYTLDEEFKEQISTGDLKELRKTLEEQHSDFMKEKGRQERLALNPTDQVYTDAQELLRLFGIPFVVAPMEAEAQCATLNVIGLTEGTITDDSDIWLFGGQVVYKNFFNQQKHVLEYRSDMIQKYFKLSREEMIKMALLVGSDYTVGLNGIGPVTALEIIAAFQSRELLDGLLRFRDWFTGAATGGPPRATLRKKIKNTIITPGFPSRAVVEAYLHPQVDVSKEPFSWAKPNLNLIHKYVRAKLGWSAEKCNELLLPVIKKLEENSNQTTIEKHFRIMPKSTITDGMLSKRVETAIKRLGGESTETDELPNAKPKKKRKPNTPKSEESTEMNRSVANPTTIRGNSGVSKNAILNENSKVKLINEKLHRNVKVPQKEMSQKLLEEKKKEAVRIFRTYKKGGKKKTRVYAKEQANLSESSSDD